MGASQGLGEATALQLASEGAHVAGRETRECFTGVKQRIEERGGSAEIAVCDLFDVNSRRTLCGMIGKLPQSISWLRTPVAQLQAWRQGSRLVWAKEFDAMVLGLIEIIDAAVDRMKEANFGQVIVIGSSGIVIPIPKLAVSNTLRSALAGYIKTLSEQVAPFGVTCNMVLPGRIDTPRTKAIDAGGAKAECGCRRDTRALGRGYRWAAMGHRKRLPPWSFLGER